MNHPEQRTGSSSKAAVLGEKRSALLLTTSLTMRHANYMGYECLLVEDCCATTDPANHTAAISMIQKQGGVFGAVVTSEKLIAALKGG